MAAPTPTARVTPSGDYMMENGYKCLITFAADPDIEIWEIGMGFPGVDNGAELNISNQHNNDVETKAPRGLNDILGTPFTCHYSGASFEKVLAIAGVKTTVTWLLPDGRRIAAFGYLKNWRPAPTQNGNVPTASGEIVITNIDPTNKVEAKPVVYAPSGT